MTVCVAWAEQLLLLVFCCIAANGGEGHLDPLSLPCSQVIRVLHTAMSQWRNNREGRRCWLAASPQGKAVLTPSRNQCASHDNLMSKARTSSESLSQALNP
jgi:hypothetical protein